MRSKPPPHRPLMPPAVLVCQAGAHSASSLERSVVDIKAMILSSVRA